MSEDLTKLPDSLPKPEDDGLCNHLLGTTLHNLEIPDSNGNLLNVADLKNKVVILYFFPLMGMPGESLPSGWNNIPGARGCTPENIAISQHKDELSKYNAIPIGVSTQSKEELSKLSKLRGLSQILLSDTSLKFKDKLDIPTFQVENKTMYRRVTLILQNSKVVKVFYPIFPPDKHIFEIIGWLKHNSA